MKFNNVQNKPLTDPETGKVVWLSRSIAVIAQIWTIFEGKNYILLTKRGPGVEGENGKWCMPCGYLDWNETLQEATVREVWEEAGFDLARAMQENIVVLDMLDLPWRVKSDPKGKQNISMHFATVFVTSEELPLLTTENAEHEEVDEARWVLQEDVSKFEMAFNHAEIIQEFLSSFTR